MPKITLRLTIALLTFAVGVAAAALWLARRAPKAEEPAVRRALLAEGVRLTTHSTGAESACLYVAKLIGL